MLNRLLIFMPLLMIISLLFTGCPAPKQAKPFPQADPPAGNFKIIAFWDPASKQPDIIPDQTGIIAAYTYQVRQNSTMQNTTGSSQPNKLPGGKLTKQQLWPVLTNDKGGYGMLVTRPARKSAVDNILREVDRYKYPGIILDWQLMPGSLQQEYKDLVSELAARLTDRGKSLGVVVLPSTRGLREPSAVFDYGFLAKHADFLILNAFDWSVRATTNPGPIAPLDWVEENVRLLLKSVPSRKLVLGIAAHGYHWVPENPETMLSLPEAFQLAKTEGVEIRRSTDGSPHFTYHRNGTTHQVWFEDGISAAKKIALARQYRLGGIAQWRLGLENREYWEQALGNDNRSAISY